MSDFAPDVQTAIANAASQAGIDPNLLTTFARIESSGNPNAQTGSYKGLYQLSPSEFAKYSGSDGDIFDPADNALAGAKKLAAESDTFAKANGREPTAAELYMIHQQGPSGAAAHEANPDGVAWQNVAKFYPNENVAKQAIWGNVPADVRAQYGDVDNITSGQFMKMWGDKVAHFGGGTTPAAATADAIQTPGAGQPGTQSGPAAAPPPAAVASNTAQPAADPSTPANSSQSASGNPLAQVLGYLGSQTAPGTPAANVGADSNTTRQAAMKSSATAAVADASPIQLPAMQKLDLTKLRAAIAARRGLA